MTNQNLEKLSCPVCDSSDVEARFEAQQFAYADGERDVLLTAQIPVMVCHSCNEVFMGADAEDAQHAAVCRYLGRLSPEEIREIRTGKGLSQASFAKETGIGIASIKRWEAGTVVQSESMDNLLRAFSAGDFDEVSVVGTPVFRTQMKPHMMEQAKSFRLRPVDRSSQGCL